jgi:hypothetical protein
MYSTFDGALSGCLVQGGMNHSHTLVAVCHLGRWSASTLKGIISSPSIYLVVTKRVLSTRAPKTRRKKMRSTAPFSTHVSLRHAMIGHMEETFSYGLTGGINAPASQLVPEPQLPFQQLPRICVAGGRKAAHLPPRLSDQVHLPSTRQFPSMTPDLDKWSSPQTPPVKSLSEVPCTRCPGQDPPRYHWTAQGGACAPSHHGGWLLRRLREPGCRYVCPEPDCP